MVSKVTRKLTQRCVDGACYDDVARELGLEPDQARRANKRLILWDGKLAGYGLSLTPKGAKTYVWFHKVRGQSRKLTVGNTKQITADHARKRVEQESASVRDGADPTRDAKQEPVEVLTVVQAFEKFLSEPKKDGSDRAPSTVHSYHKKFNRFIEPIIGDMPVTNVKQPDCNRVLEAAAAGEGSDTLRKTQHNRVRALLKAILTWCYDRELIEIVPRMRKRYAEKEHAPSVTRADVRALARALDEYAHDNKHRSLAPALIRMLLITGARSGEVLSLRWSDVDEAEGTITVRKYKGSTHANAKPRVFFITPEVDEILQQAKTWRRNDFIFPGRRDHYKALRKDWSHFRRHYLTRHIRVHDLRHTAGSTAVGEAGLTLKETGALLGHKYSQTTDRYAHVQLDVQRRAAHQLSAKLSELMRGSS